MNKTSTEKPTISGFFPFLNDWGTIGESRSAQAMHAALLPFITHSRSLYVLSDLNISEQHTYCKKYILDRNNTQGVVLPFISVLIIGFFGYLTFINFKKKEGEGYKMILTYYLIFQLIHFESIQYGTS